MENGEGGTPGMLVKDRRPDALGYFNALPDEVICFILEYLTPRDIARLACVSSVMYIFCNEEPLWMTLCLRKACGLLEYNGSWKRTTLLLEGLSIEYIESCRRSLHFDGFYSSFLYRRLYRCHTRLDSFSFDDGNVERKKIFTAEEFHSEYNGRKPVLLSGLADAWPARNTWAIDQLSQKYGDTAFKISQRSAQKISMKLKDYVSYMNFQHDEDPLYIFDEKFGEAAPGLLKDYSVPYLFQEDLFDVLDIDQRPSFRWLIMGPERSGASWHVDPGLTSAWNTLLCGRKRWALYPPGRVPLGVTVHVNDEDGDVNIESPASLQWWLDFYPLLPDEEKPIECTQLPGETIFVPSGWWHCVLNLENTVAVTQNFVDSKNFEFVCLDMAPGYRHKGVCRAGLLALDEASLADLEERFGDVKSLTYPDTTRKEKRCRSSSSEENADNEIAVKSASRIYNLWKHGFHYDINFLAKFLDEERDHYNAPWGPGNTIGPRELREWLSKLWSEKPEMRDLLWKGACLALNAAKWSERLAEICAFHKLPPPTDEERLPVGTGSNPVYLVDDYVIKIFVEEGLESSLYDLGTELEFYSLLGKVISPLKNHVPDVLATGILSFDSGSYTIVPWDGKVVPEVIDKCNLNIFKCEKDGFPFGLWGKKVFQYGKAGKSVCESSIADGCTGIWPYIITKRCKGKIFAQLRDTLSGKDLLKLASFLGEQLRSLHLLPYPPLSYSAVSDIEQKMGLTFTDGCMKEVFSKSDFPAEWEIFIRTLTRKRRDVISRLTNWGHPIPKSLIEKVDKYLPDDFAKLLDVYQDEHGLNQVCKPCSWIHADIMDDNVMLEPLYYSGIAADGCSSDNGSANDHDHSGEYKSWQPSYILDFSGLSVGDPLYDLIPIYLDVFRGESTLFNHLLQSYRLALLRRMPQTQPECQKFARLSYHAMCYCILHDENVLGAIFGLWKELRTAKSWEEVELAVWGELNNYKGFS